MGLFSDNHYHRHDHSTHIRFPDTIKEIKAPTDESIKMLNEMQEKVIDNVISKIEVKDNVVEGQIYVIDGMRTTASDEVKVICKFKINGQEFVVEKSWSRWDIRNEVKTIEINNQILEYGKSIMLYFALKQFSAIAHKQILGAEIPTYYLRNIFEK
jgi:hypothetical protein